MNNEQKAHSLTSASIEQNGLLPAVSRKYRPTYNQWQKICDETEIDPFCSHASMELINFQNSKIHLKDGLRLSFDCLSEAQYIHVLNGGYYEDAPPINEDTRI